MDLRFYPRCMYPGIPAFRGQPKLYSDTLYQNPSRIYPLICLSIHHLPFQPPIHHLHFYPHPPSHLPIHPLLTHPFSSHLH